MNRSILAWWGILLLFCLGSTFADSRGSALTPEISNLSLTSTSGLDLTHDDLICSYDLGGDATTAATAWYVGTPALAPLMAFYLPMEGGAANAVKDYSGNGITAVVHGNPVWNATAGHDGKGAWVLDGNDDLSGGENFPVSSSYTITAWVYRTGSGNNGGNNVVAGDANTGGHAFWAPDSYGNKLSAGHNGTWNSVQDPVALALNTWFFVSLTYNSDTKQMVLYKNGSQVSSATVTAAATDATISVGSFGYSNGFMWKGTLDDVRIYKRALSAKQILSLYYDGGNVIKDTETQTGEDWQARVTSFSATEAGTTAESNTLTIVDGSPIAPAFASSPVTAATIGEPYAYDADAAGSPSPTYALTAPPSGMTINSYTGLIQWTPSAAGSYAVTVTATNTAGTATQPYALVVSAGPVPEIANLTLTSTSGFDLTTDDLTCGFDLTSTATTAATAWYVGTPTLAPLMAFYLPMEGGATNAAKDYSGNGITAAINGNPVWNATAGHDGKGAWVLDGSDDLSGGENFPVSSSYTISAWVYRTGSGNNGGNNIVAGNDNTGGHAFWAPDMFGNKLSAGHNGTWNSVQDPVVLALNTWFFVSLTYNNDTKQMVLYKNGSPVSSATVTAAVTDATISVGSFGFSNGYMWKGTLDDVRIYKRALSAEQIASLYATGHNGIKHTETEVGDSWQARVTPFSATDAGSTYESNTIVIQGAAVPPEITSTPVTDAAIGELYTYDVEATGNPTPEYLLWVSPAGMTIDEITGVIEWTPSASGTVPVGVVAFNSAGADTQSYEITVPELPGVTDLVLTSTYGKFSTTDELLCQFNLSGPAVTSATAWYVGGSPLVPLMTLYLPAEGGAATALKDYSGNGFHATAHGNPVWLATGGHDGRGAWSLDGTGDDLGAGEHFPTGASYTKTAWVYRTGSGQNGGNNVISGDENAGGHAFWAPDMFGNKLSAGHNAVWDIVQDAVPLGLNQWYFVAVSFDYATGLMVLYKDGVIVDSAVVPPSDLNVTDATISIGSFGAANGWMWKGQLDDLRVYGRALSPGQVAALYNDGANVIAPPETEIGELWMACVTPFSESTAGATACTDTITVMDETVPVFVRSIESRWINNRVEIAWALRDAPAAVEFDIYRSDDAVAQFVRLQDAEITRRGDEYVFTDESAMQGKSYTYRVSVLEGGKEVASFETSLPAAALRFALEQNHPNPFNPVTNISFSLDTEADLTLRVYDISGRLVRTLIERRMSPGVHTESWDGRSDTGDEVASGIYFYRLTAGERTLTRKAVFLK